MVQIDVSTIGFDRWMPVGGRRTAVRRPLRTTWSRWTPPSELADRAGPFDLVLYNAGMDPVRQRGVCDDLGPASGGLPTGPAGTTTGLVFALAGGYTSGQLSMDGLVDLHMLTVEAFG